MKIKSNFYIPFHKQLIQYSLDHAYKNEFVTFEEIKNLCKPQLLGTTGEIGLKEADILYIFDLLVHEGYLIQGVNDINMYFITGKGRIFYLTTYW